MQTLDIQSQLVAFVYAESRMLDEGRYRDWYDLFADDGVYWVPTRPEHTERDAQVAIALENKMLLALRVERLSHPRAFSLQPKVRCMHVMQQPEVLCADADGGLSKLSTQLVYMEHQAGRQIVLGARAFYTLRPAGASFQIVEKRVELLNSDDFLPAIQLFI
ncbi:aromatic-ring-hydroxylating dioxygenase subunit beta [Pusillimonas minor]|nr:aromatic-ring-hydroxylating dioxygenase subunit beta [Pusillimonas minor]